ncbi:hypothetical protein CMQ_218 [Grosmannia clavigera kw1407]|uniref:Uncharacterized protein n=1 Tax=Grosmannia clavigera (strain kw1407 / UAMH 11150) TaxID=655863 RepID=F0XRC6_GROCL|nr:uncharacterized protein CMQ_218 [Grosmannia clavigera kw1407]EFW99900.1 hypothetical protein CMQ_218 [Grosmannia clavigera kw1407]
MIVRIFASAGLQCSLCFSFFDSSLLWRESRNIAVEMEYQLLSPSLRCSQNIALLSILPTFRSQATEEALRPDLSISSKSDDSLVQVLAYLAAIDVDPKHVTAVAVEGAAEAFSLLHVHVAINKARPGDGHAVLERIVASFQRLFLIMVVNRSGTYKPPANKRCCSFLGGQLQEFVDALQKLARPAKQPDPDLQEFLARSVELITELDPLRPAIFTADATHPDSASLVRVVYSVYLYSKVLGDRLGGVLDRLTGRHINLTVRDVLKRRLHGLACFVRCAHFLCRLALNETPPWLGNVEVVPVQLTAANFVSLKLASASAAATAVSQTPSPPSLDACLAQWNWTAARLEMTLRKRNYSIPSPRLQFTTTCNQLYGSTPNKPKIHAEIQIAYHLDSQNKDRRDVPPSDMASLVEAEDVKGKDDANNEPVASQIFLGGTEPTPPTTPPTSALFHARSLAGHIESGSQDKADSGSDSDATVQQIAVGHGQEGHNDTPYDVVFHSTGSRPTGARRYATNELELFITFGSEDGGVRDPAVPQSSVRARKLPVDEAASYAVHAVDVSGLACGSEVPAIPIGTDGRLHLRAGSDIYEVLISTGEARQPAHANV